MSNMTMSPIDAFLANVRPESERTRYGCNVFNRGRKPCRGTNLYHVGPNRNFTICKKHKLSYYDTALGYLQERLKKDHDSDLHGAGDERKAFAEPHEDTSGLFTLSCPDCRDAMASEELGVKPEDVERAKTIKALMEQADTRYKRVLSSFDETYKSSPVDAVARYGDSLLATNLHVTYFRNVLATMELRSCDLVEAYDIVVERMKEQLINDSLGDDDRPIASKFVKGGAYW